MVINLECVFNSIPDIECFTVGNVYECTEMTGDEEFPYFVENDIGEYISVDLDYNEVQFKIVE